MQITEKKIYLFEVNDKTLLHINSTIDSKRIIFLLKTENKELEIHFRREDWKYFKRKLTAFQVRDYQKDKRFGEKLNHWKKGEK